MKKFAIFGVLFALFMGGCAENNLENIAPTHNAISLPDLSAGFAEDNRTYVENNKNLRWHEADLISAFFGNTLNRQYKFKGQTGDNSGTFSLVPNGELGTGNNLDAIYAVYPYNEATTITDKGTLTINLPSVQTYAENSFGKGANTMIAVTETTEDTFLGFKNTCGYLKLKFYNADGATLKSVEVKGNNGEKIAGSASTTIEFGGVPTLIMNDTATTTITLDCCEGIELGTTADTATELWIVLPETTFENGITITATDVFGGTFEKSTSNTVTITRNEIQPMVALEADFISIPQPANNEIWYTNGSTTEPTEPYNKTVFGATYISNTYDTNKECWIITFDGDVTSVGSSAFENCSNLVSVSINNSVTSIGSRAFYNCSSLANINIPDSVSSIGSSAFSGCSSLSSIIIPDGVTKIESSAFSRCAFTKLPKLPNSITTYAASLFSGCNELINVTIPNNIVSLGNSVFARCSNLASVEISDSVTEIGSYAFNMCSSLVEVVIPHGSVTAIAKYTFSECTSLKELTIGEGVKQIGESVCNKCTSLTKLSLPSTVLEIDKNAFSSCSALQAIYCRSTSAPKIYAWANTSTYSLPRPSSNMKIYIPRGSYYYQDGTRTSSGLEAENWNEYKDRLEEYDYIYN